MNMQSFAFILNPIAVNNKAFIPRFPYFCNRIGEAKISKFILYRFRLALSLGEFYQFNLSSCIRQQNSLTAQFVSFSLSNLANIFYPSQFLQ